MKKYSAPLGRRSGGSTEGPGCSALLGLTDGGPVAQQQRPHQDTLLVYLNPRCNGIMGPPQSRTRYKLDIPPFLCFGKKMRCPSKLCMGRLVHLNKGKDWYQALTAQAGRGIRHGRMVVSVWQRTRIVFSSIATVNPFLMLIANASFVLCHPLLLLIESDSRGMFVTTTCFHGEKNIPRLDLWARKSSGCWKIPFLPPGTLRGARPVPHVPCQAPAGGRASEVRGSECIQEGR